MKAIGYTNLWSPKSSGSIREETSSMDPEGQIHEGTKRTQSPERWGPVRSLLSLNTVLNFQIFLEKIKESHCSFEVKN